MKDQNKHIKTKTKKRLPPHLDRDLEDLPNEEWRAVIGYEGYYEVSNLGRVKGLERRTRNHILVNQKIRKLRTIKGNNIEPIQFKVDGVRTKHPLLQLVAEAFLGKSANAEQVYIHKDKNGLNNTPENVLLGTRQQSLKMNLESGCMRTGGEVRREICEIRYADYLESYGVYGDGVLKALECPVCGKVRNTNMFYYQSVSPTRYMRKCKVCYNAKRSKPKRGGHTHTPPKVPLEKVREYAEKVFGASDLDDISIAKYTRAYVRGDKPKYEIDGKGFRSRRQFCIYMKDAYDVSIDATLWRLQNGKRTPEQLKRPSLKFNKGRIRVTDTVTGEVYLFKNMADPAIDELTSGWTLQKGLKTGKPVGGHHNSKHPNPLLIERIKD